MRDGYTSAIAMEPSGETLGNIDRAMTPAGAPDGDGEVAFAFALVAWQQRLEPAAKLIEERRKIRICGDVFADRGVLARKRLQPGNIMRIAQETDIEHEIGVARQALAERERRHEDAEAGLDREMEMPMQHTLQITGRQQRRIDDEIGAIAQRAHALALQANAVADRTLGRERMRAARLGVAPLETIVVAIEEDDAQIEALIVDQAVERRDQRRDGEVARTHIDAERERRLIGRRHDEIGQERERQIIDRFVAHILESLECRRAPGPRHASDDDQLAARMRRNAHDGTAAGI